MESNSFVSLCDQKKGRGNKLKKKNKITSLITTKKQLIVWRLAFFVQNMISYQGFALKLLECEKMLNKDNIVLLFPHEQTDSSETMKNMRNMTQRKEQM